MFAGLSAALNNPIGYHIDSQCIYIHGEPPFTRWWFGGERAEDGLSVVMGWNTR